MATEANGHLAWMDYEVMYVCECGRHLYWDDDSVAHCDCGLKLEASVTVKVWDVTAEEMGDGTD